MRLARVMLMAVAVPALLLSACSAAPTTADDTGSASSVEGAYLNDFGAEAIKLGEPVEGGSLRVALEAPLDTIDPTKAEGSGASQLLPALFDELAVWGPDGSVVPELAEAIETPDGGKTWTITLPSGVTFTDGTPFDAAAVVAHWQRLAAEGSTSRRGADVRALEGLEATDAQTVTVTLAEPSMVWPQVLVAGPAAMNWIPSPTQLAADPVGASLTPIGAGPFKVESFTPGGDIVLARNEDYRIEGLPHLDEVTFITATDTQSRLSAAIAGDIDLAPTTSSRDLADATNSGLISLKAPTAQFYQILMNLKKEPFVDVRFREALIRSIDLQGLNDAIFKGRQNPMTGIVPSDNPFFVDTEWPAFDPDLAKELVAEWSADTGLDPEFTLTTTSPPEFQKQAAIIQQMLKETGITMNIEVGDQPSMISAATSGEYIAQHRGIIIGIAPYQDLKNNFGSESAANNGKVGNPALDETLEKIKMAESEELSDLYAEAQRELRDWMPLVPLIQWQKGWYFSDSVAGFPGATYNGALDMRKVWAASK